MTKSIGVGVFIKRQNTILLGKRGSACKLGAGCLALPGGLVNDNENLEQAALREVKEETGLSILFKWRKHTGSKYRIVPGVLAVTEDLEINRITFWLLAEWIIGEPQVLEPNKCDYWKWYTIDEVFKVIDPKDKNQQYWTPLKLWNDILFDHFKFVTM